MRSRRRYVPVFKHENLVKIHDSTKAVSYHDKSLAPCELVYGFLPLVLVLGVSESCSLVENDYRRVLQDGSGYCYALPFAASKACAGVTGVCVEPHGKPRDKVGAPGLICRTLYLGV